MPSCPCDGSLGSPQKLSGRYEENNFFPCQESNSVSSAFLSIAMAKLVFSIARACSIVSAHLFQHYCDYIVWKIQGV
jgi:hypothetical protein